MQIHQRQLRAKQPREAAARIRVDVGGHGPAIRIHLESSSRRDGSEQRRTYSARDRLRRPRAPRTGADPCRAGTRSGQDRAAARRRSRCRFPRAVHAAPRRPASRPLALLRDVPVRGIGRVREEHAAGRIEDHDAARHRAARRPASSRECSALLQLPLARGRLAIDGLERHRLALRGDLGRDFAAGLAVRLGRARRELRIDLRAAATALPRRGFAVLPSSRTCTTAFDSDARSVLLK